MKRIRMTVALSLVMPLTLLAACSGADKDQGAGKAAGEVLPGSTSDAMLPLDTVRSQAPLAPRAEGGTKAKSAQASDAAVDGAAAEGAEAPAEAAEPAPAAQE